MAGSSVRRWALLLALASMIVASAAARQAQQQPQAILEEPAMAITLTTGKSAQGTATEPPSLLTYYFDMDKPDVELLPAAQGSGRPGRTPLRVQLSGAAAVSTFMPVVSPRPTGMTHQVVKTWDALKNYAFMFARVNAINAQAAGNSPRLFPVPGIAVTAADDAIAATTAVGAFIDAAEARGQRDAWTETSPGSMLLMPAVQAVAAVADIMGITHDEAADTMTLDLELVHDPEMVSEFDHHGKQTLDAKTSHFHFATPAGVKVDAAGLLTVLQESDYKLPALHVFVKGIDRLVIATLGGHHHVHERVPVTVTAYGGTDPVADVLLTFAIAGDCEPSLTTSTATTDASGRATVYVSAGRPGTVAVAAATNIGKGRRLVTNPVHIYFSDEYEEYHHDHHHGHHHDHHDSYHYAATEAYGEEGPEPGSDAERFATEATKKALAMLPA